MKNKSSINVFPKNLKQVSQILDKIAENNKRVVVDLNCVYGGTWPEVQPAWPESTGTKKPFPG